MWASTFDLGTIPVLTFDLLLTLAGPEARPPDPRGSAIGGRVRLISTSLHRLRDDLGASVQEGHRIGDVSEKTLAPDGKLTELVVRPRS